MASKKAKPASTVDMSVRSTSVKGDVYVSKSKLKPGNGNTKVTSATGYVRWWNADEEDVYERVFSVLNAIGNDQQERSLANIRYMRLYRNFTGIMTAGTCLTRLRASNSNAGRGYKFTFNVAESIVDTAVAMIAKSEPICEILTSGGNFKQQKKAKQLKKYLNGQCDKLKVHTQCRRGFKDATVFGTGCVKVFIEDDQVKCKQICIDDIVVDESDGADGNPTQLHQKGHADRDVLCALFPDFVDKIMTASSAFSCDLTGPANDQFAAVLESWHLPSSSTSKDGKHVICLDNCTLAMEDWDEPWFPFAFIRWKEDQVCFYGCGLMEQLAPIQAVITKNCIRIDMSQEKLSRQNMFIDSAAQIQPEMISAAIGSVIRVKGNPNNSVMQMIPQAMSQEVYAWVENAFSKAFQVSGINQMTAQGEKPEGVDSAVAMRELQDLQSGRFELVSRQYDAMVCEVLRLILYFSKQLYENGVKDLKVKVADRRFMDTIDWKDAALEPDEYEMKMFPVSALPTYPAGRLQTITELIQTQIIQPEVGLRLLDFPDLQDEMNLQTAGQNCVKMQVDGMRWDGENSIPDNLIPIDFAIAYCHNSILEARMIDTPDENMRLMEAYLTNCLALKQAMNPPPPPAPPPPGAGGPQPPPLAKPPALPTNALLPR